MVPPFVGWDGWRAPHSAVASCSADVPGRSGQAHGMFLSGQDKPGAQPWERPTLLPCLTQPKCLCCSKLWGVAFVFKVLSCINWDSCFEESLMHPKSHYICCFVVLQILPTVLLMTIIFLSNISRGDFGLGNVFLWMSLPSAFHLTIADLIALKLMREWIVRQSQKIKSISVKRRLRSGLWPGLVCSLLNELSANQHLNLQRLMKDQRSFQ